MKRTCPEQGRRIDPHCHCRDGKEVYKTDIRKVSELAKKEGIVHICDMPSVKYPILRESDVTARLELAKKRKPAVGYSLFMSLTANEKQIREAVKVAGRYNEVAGFKLRPPETQKKKIYEELARQNYRGVLAVHAEKTSLFRPELFDHKKPWTHNLAQPREAEIASIKEQIQFAREANFRGILYICHITLPESAEIIWEAKKYLNIYSEVTPHHLLLSERNMHGEDGLLLKVDPPLRAKESVRGLVKSVMLGLVDCIGTDYARHVLLEKLYQPYLSGIACYPFYGQALGFLRAQGVSEKDIEKLTYWNIKKIFGEKLKDA